MYAMHVLITALRVTLGQEHATLVKPHLPTLRPTTHASANLRNTSHQATSAPIVLPTARPAPIRRVLAQAAALHSV